VITRGSDWTQKVEVLAVWLLAFLWAAPLLYAIWAAFHPMDFISRFVLTAPLTLDNFRNAWKVAAAARLRWRCENEGFNVLKNGGFALEHVYSRNPVASKGYFLLMLTAHVFQQLLTRGRLGTVFKAAFHTFRHYGKQMLEALRNQALPTDRDPPGQIRLSTA